MIGLNGKNTSLAIFSRTEYLDKCALDGLEQRMSIRRLFVAERKLLAGDDKAWREGTLWPMRR